MKAQDTENASCRSTFKRNAFFVFCLGGMSILPIVNKISVDSSLLETLFNVSSVFYAIGMGVILTYSPPSRLNESRVKNIRARHRNIRKGYSFFYIVSVVLFVLQSFKGFLSVSEIGVSVKVFHFAVGMNVSLFSLLLILLSMFYFITMYTKIYEDYIEIEENLAKERAKK